MFSVHYISQSTPAISIKSHQQRERAATKRATTAERKRKIIKTTFASHSLKSELPNKKIIS